MQNIVALVAMVTLVAFLVWSGVRAWRAKRPLAKWGGVVLAATLAVPLSGVSALTVAGIVKSFVCPSNPRPTAPAANRRRPRIDRAWSEPDA